MGNHNDMSREGFASSRALQMLQFLVRCVRHFRMVIDPSPFLDVIQVRSDLDGVLNGLPPSSEPVDKARPVDFTGSNHGPTEPFPLTNLAEKDLLSFPGFQVEVTEPDRDKRGRGVAANYHIPNFVFSHNTVRHEPVTGIEPARSAWKAEMQPLHLTGIGVGPHQDKSKKARD